MLFAEEHMAVLECLLFATPEPLGVKDMGSILGLGPAEVEEILEELINSYNTSPGGLQIMAVAGGYKMATKPDYADYLARLYRPRTSVLSKAAMETLSIVAYRQPVTRAEIEAVRGVKVDYLLATLQEKNLIQEVGRKETPGRPILYSTTLEFLKYLGLASLEDLPPLQEAPVKEES